MTKKQPPPDVIVGAGQTVTVESSGRTYVLRAPTFGEAGQLTARSVAAVQPSDAIFAEALRDAVRAAPLPEKVRAAHLAAIDEHEAAHDALEGLFMANGLDRTAWDADVRREMAAAQRALLTAQRARQKAEWAVRESPDVVALRQGQIAGRQAEQAELVALCVVSVGKEMVTLTADDVRAMPASDALAIADRAAALVRPTPAAEKN